MTMLELDSRDHVYFHAWKRGKRELFFRCHWFWHETIFNDLHDLGYTIRKIEKWYYWAQTDKRHPDKIPDGLAFDIDRNDPDLNIDIWRRNLKKNS